MILSKIPVVIPNGDVCMTDRYINKTKRWRVKTLDGTVLKFRAKDLHTPTLSCTSPSKIILTGEHAVVHGYSAVATATDKSVITYYFPSSKPEVTIIIPEFSLRRCWNVGELETMLPLRGEGDCGALRAQAEAADPELVSQVFLLFLSVFGFPLEGGTFVSSFRVPIAAGMGSSASFAVSLLGVMLKLKKSQPQFLKKYGKISDQKLIPFIEKWSYEAEMLCHGKPSGIDNTVALRGGTVDFKKKTDWRPISKASSFPLLVVNLNVPKKTKEIIQRVSKLRENAPEIVNSIFSTMGKISEQVIESLSTGAFDRDLIQLLFRMNHGLLHSLTLAHPNACKVEAVCAEFNVFPKITGAGFGGCLISTVPDGFLVSDLRRALIPLKANCFLVKTNQKGVRWMENIQT